MNIFDNNKSDHLGHEKKISCNNKSGICLDKNQASRVIALLLIIACFIFIAGYFWGQRSAINQLLNSVERDSFADQIHYSMCSIYDQKDDAADSDDASSSDEEADQGEQQIETTEPSETMQHATNNIKVNASELNKNQKKYIAQLAGFGTEKHARQLIQRLNKRGIKVELRKRQSKTSRGKIVPWYQVVSEEYSDRNTLNQSIASIKRSEKLHDIQVIETV